MNNIKVYNLYIGLKDKDKLMQILTKEEFLTIVTSVCKDEQVEFSMGEVYGGYISKDGSYLLENSLKLTFTGISKEKVIDISKRLKLLLNQEDIFITSNDVEVIEVN